MRVCVCVIERERECGSACECVFCACFVREGESGNSSGLCHRHRLRWWQNIARKKSDSIIVLEIAFYHCICLFHGVCVNESERVNV